MLNFGIFGMCNIISDIISSKVASLLIYWFWYICGYLFFIYIGRSQSVQPANKGSYSQVGFSYDGNGKEEAHFSDADEEDEEEEEDDDEFNSDDSNDEGMDKMSKEFGVKRYGWLVYMDKRVKEEEKDRKK